MGGSALSTIKGSIDIKRSDDQMRLRRDGGEQNFAELVVQREAGFGRPETSYTYRQTGRDTLDVFKSENSK